ncbi:MAG: arginine deiminase family protein [Thermoflexales bacterium]|nr:arginine deiminase family protein [Thermoflexales bacterium]
MSALPAPFVAQQAAEWLPARVVLVCEPRIETLFALLHTEAASFLYPFALREGQAEHRAFRQLMEALGVQVIDVREVLCSADPNLLRAWARAAVNVSFAEEVSPALRAEATQQVTSAIAQLDAETLADLILLRPTLHLEPAQGSDARWSRLRARFGVRPAHSAYYVRDPIITTARGCVITRLDQEDRAAENDIAEHVLQGLGITPIFRVQPPGTLEGGDFIPCGDFVLQGQGLFTNAEGVKQCLEARVYGYVEVAVVEDPRSALDEMHLDTYFAMLDRDLALCLETRLHGADEPAVHIYQPEGTPDQFRYVLTRSTLFSRYLEEKGIKVIPVSKEEQQCFGINGLTLAPKQWVGVRHAGAALHMRLRSAGVTVHETAYAALAGGYGGLHCSTQVLLRAT